MMWASPAQFLEGSCRPSPGANAGGSGPSGPMVPIGPFKTVVWLSKISPITPFLERPTTTTIFNFSREQDQSWPSWEKANELVDYSLEYNIYYLKFSIYLLY